MKKLGAIDVYENLNEIVDPKHTALLVWDVVEVLIKNALNKEQFITNLKSFIETARRSHVPVFYAKTVLLPASGQSSWRLYTFMRDSGVTDPTDLPAWLKPGSKPSEIVSEVGPQPDDIVINKHTASIFVGTHFEYMLRNRGINTILFTGYSTEVGVDSSARDSSNRGFYTVIVEDRAASSNKKAHASILDVLRHLCIVIPYQNIIKEWQH